MRTGSGSRSLKKNDEQQFQTRFEQRLTFYNSDLDTTDNITPIMVLLIF